MQGHGGNGCCQEDQDEVGGEVGRTGGRKGGLQGLAALSLLCQRVAVQCGHDGVGRARDIEQDGRYGTAETVPLGHAHEHGDTGDGAEIKGERQQKDDAYIGVQAGDAPQHHARCDPEHGEEQVFPLEHKGDPFKNLVHSSLSSTG